MVKITDIRAIVTAPNKINLVVVKIDTNQSGLHGYGCATFTWRYKAVVTVIEEYLKPMLIGRSVSDIEDIWQTVKGSSYWRNGPVLNNALSGVDEALWDIKGKMANMPLYQLFGGKSRAGAAVYRHADGKTMDEVEENVCRFMEEGYRYIRVQLNTYGGNFDGSKQNIWRPEGAPDGAYFDPKTYMRHTIALFERLRCALGDEIELLHDVHERLPLVDAMSFVKALEPYRLFFVEDALPPDQVRYFKYLREQTSVPLAVGELFCHSLEWKEIIQNQWIDFIRTHISDLGGLTPARKLAAFAEVYGVRTAWHGPGDLSVIGMAAQLHLDIHVHNFGIQEFQGFSSVETEMFPGAPEIRNGYVYINEAPGIGVEFDEEMARKYPPVCADDRWMFARFPDGTAVRP